MIWSSYIAREVYKWILVMAFFVFAIDILVSFIDKSSNLGKGNFSVGGLVLYLIMLLPSKAYDYFLGITLLGTMIALARLAGQSEIVAAESCGLSPRRLMLTMIFVAIPLLTLLVWLGESVSPQMRIQAEDLRIALRYPDYVKPDPGQLWFKHEEHFIYVGKVLTNSELSNVQWYQFDENFNLKKQVVIQKASLIKDSNWKLFKVSERTFTEKDVSSNEIASLEVKNWLNPDLLKPFVQEPSVLSTKELLQYSSYLNSNQLDATFYTLTAYKRILYPLTLILLFSLVVPLVFGLPRGQSLAGHVFLGIALGFGYLLLSEIATHASLGLGVWPIAAASLPLIVVLLLTTTVIYTQNR